MTKKADNPDPNKVLDAYRASLEAMQARLRGRRLPPAESLERIDARLRAVDRQQLIADLIKLRKKT